MKRTISDLTLILWVCLVILSGCSTQNDHLVHFRSKDPFHPRAGSELLQELKKNLPPDVTPDQFFFNQRKDEMRGSILVDGKNAKEAVMTALRDSPTLALVSTEKASGGGTFMVCFSSCEPFKPSDEAQLLAELKRNLNSQIIPKVLMVRKDCDRMVAWVLVKGNLDKAAVKFAVRQNSNLSLLQVEHWNLATRIASWGRLGEG